MCVEKGMRDNIIKYILFDTFVKFEICAICAKRCLFKYQRQKMYGSL